MAPYPSTPEKRGEPRPPRWQPVELSWEEKMEDRKQETGNEKLDNVPPASFARFPFPVSGFLFFIRLGIGMMFFALDPRALGWAPSVSSVPLW